ncbi:hypothetical protein PSDVSF_23560 [Pseudodesulfovibrio sediminis]|uniref:Methanolan biosynthesis EpsI domain-containing protein n=1 Tax=Pseudodesulfovibrio sediminis TaxID=2810563 RepID=A0ABM7P6E5_9BACT|nr:hypothetical protein PSDVSF_23560 [Pseudodesulfovibrio sediminis]
MAALFFTTWGTIEKLTAKWIHSEEYSHGFIILIVALYLGWHRLVSKKPEIKPSWHGLWVLGVAFSFIVIGRISAFDAPGFYGLLVALVGLCLVFCGTQTTRVLGPAFVYLLFAIPLPLLLYFSFSHKLQLISSTLGVLPLQLAGIPVYQEGNIIDLGVMTLQVVDACSGLRYIFPLASFGYLVAYLMDDALWKRVLILISTVPIAVMMNAFRLSVIGFTVPLWGKAAAEGIVHDFEGWSVFLVCLAFLAGEYWLLSRIGKPGRLRKELLFLPKGTLFSKKSSQVWPGTTALVVCLALALTVGRGMVDARSEATPPHVPFISFPKEFKSWKGRVRHLDSKTLGKLKLTDYLMVDYTRDGEPSPVNCYMAYYASQRMGSTLHAPTNCIAGSGWRIDNREEKFVVLDNGEQVAVSRMLISSRGGKQIVYYWFVQQGRRLTNEYTVRIYLLVDALFKHRTDGTLIRLITPVANSETEEEGDARIEAFLRDVEPLIQTHSTIFTE